MKKAESIPIVSLFSGGGFMDMGFINAGFRVVYANEFNKVFAELHDEGVRSWAAETNHDFCSISSTDSLSDLKPEDILKKAFPQGTPSLWGIIGGPPCQDFTMSGNGQGFKGNRGKMTQIFYNRIRKMRPSFFVMENVVGLLMRKEPRRILDTLLLNNICPDYYVDRQVLNALNFGVPQYRKRVFIVGLRKDLFSPDDVKNPSVESIRSMSFTWPKPEFDNPLSLNWPKEVPFGSTDVVKPKEIPDKLCVMHCLDGAESLPNGREYMVFAKNAEKRKEINEGDTHRRSFRRLHRYRYSPTTCFGNNEVFLHPIKNRRLTVREALRIQSVSDDYVFGAGRYTAKFKVISNGVPVRLAEAVAKSLYEFVEKNSNRMV
jgi:DNA (cytosine-5)-methyltransferase 1